MKKRVTVVVTTYNIAPLLARCIAGINMQEVDRREVEIVLADDGSSDDWLQAVGKLNAGFEMKLIRQRHAGYRLATLKNKAIHAAKGAIVALLDGDMIPPPHWLRSHLQAHEHTEGSTISIGKRIFIDTSAISTEALISDWTVLNCLPEVTSVSNFGQVDDRRLRELGALINHPAPYHLLHGCNCAFPRDLALKAGLFDTSFDGNWGYEDTEFAYRLWRNGGKFVWAVEGTAFHQENHVLSLNERIVGDHVNFRLACERIPGFREFKLRLNAANRTPWW